MRIKETILFTCILALSLASCKKDYLLTNPTDAVANTAVFSTTQNVDVALNGIYRFMFQRTPTVTTNQQNKPGVGGIMLLQDFLGDDIHISTSNWFAGEASWVPHRTDTHIMLTYTYRTFYQIIGNANAIIDNVDAATGTDADKSRIKAEALTLRAYAHFWLVQLYGKRYDGNAKPNTQLGVPLMLASTDTNKPRSTVEEVYEAVIKDLDAAIALNATAVYNKTHAGIWIAKGIRARVALVMQDYPNAIKFAKDIIDNGGFTLMTTDEYLSGFNNMALKEYIWASHPTVDQDDTFGSFYGQIAFNANTSYMRGNPKRINSALYNLIPATDVRKKLWEPAPTATNFPLPATTFSRQPYMSRKFSVNLTTGASLGDVPLMRAAEMYLILAEAYASSGDNANAQTTLFNFVSKRDPSAIRSANTGQALVNEILINRRTELWGEGHRWLDLKRLNLPLDRTVVPNFVSAVVAGTMLVPAGDLRWQYLIPRAEMDANKSLAGQQNP